MDSHFVIKMLHASFALAAFVVLLVRGYPVLSRRSDLDVPRPHKAVNALQHISYSILVLSGLWLLWLKRFHVEPWFYAKIVLFIVILSASAKAFKKTPEILPVQRQAGIVIAALAFCALFALIIIKPQLG